MESGVESSSGVHEEDAGSKRSNQNCIRHTPQQIHYLEMFFKECAHPDVRQRKQISRELGLEPCQVKFWFQNKRTLMKTQVERADNNSLRCENERVKCENLSMQKALRNAFCSTCRDPSVSKEEHNSNIEKLRLENANLKMEYERVAIEAARLTGKTVSEINTWVSSESPVDFSADDLLPIRTRGSGFNLCHSNGHPAFNLSHSEPISSDVKSVMVETAVHAINELLQVLSSDKPLWTSNNGRYSLNSDCYEKVFTRPRHHKHTMVAKLESSKASCNVATNAIVLVNMILDSCMWLDLFPTIVTKSEILRVVETGMPGNRSGSLHLIHEVMHSLSPLVTPREFYLLRYCQQVKIDTWVIVNVSFGIPGADNPNTVPHCWKLPSGCMIQDMTGGHSKVTWLELVEVDSRAFTHQFYTDITTSGLVFGAERWISTLKQMCDRAALSYEVLANTEETTWSAEGKRGLMDLSHRMLKEFCQTLNLPFRKLDSHCVLETDNSGIHVSTHKCSDQSKPDGMVLCVSTSLCIPLSPQHVFAFFQDKKMRTQWDFLSHGNQVKEIMRAVGGYDPSNNVSVFQPVVPGETNIAILQESYVDLLGYYLVFAPLELTSINMAISGTNLSNMPVIPSGFVITGDGRSVSPNVPDNQSLDEDAGSLLTVAFQFLLSGSPYTKQKHMEAVASASTLITSTVENIKAALIPSSSLKFAVPSTSTASLL